MTKSIFPKISIILFSLILLADQIFSFYYIKKIDKKYSDIITKYTTILREYEINIFETGNIQRSLLNMALVPPRDFIIWKNKIEKSQLKIDSAFIQLQKICNDQKEKDVLGNLINTSLYYNKKYKELEVKLLAENDKGTHQNKSIEELSEIYNIYMLDYQQGISVFRGIAQIKNHELTSKSNVTGSLVLFFGTLPFLILFCIIIGSVIIIIWFGNSLQWFKREN